MPVPTPIDYQSLSMNEINDGYRTGSTKNDLIAAGVGMINPLVVAWLNLLCWTAHVD